MRLTMALASMGALGGAVWSASAGCSLPDATATTDAIGPDRAQFAAYVAPVMVRRCGSIDCHGSKYRNMRVYGYGGQRAGDSGTTPDVPLRVTEDEADRTYDSIVGLEPEIMRDVVQSGGVGPERLTFVRKGRGDEDHKGNRRITPGDDSDRCITSWLSSKVDQDACNKAGCIVFTDAGPDAAPIKSIGSCTDGP